MAPDRRVSPGQTPSRRIPVLVGTLPIEDGQTPPPVVGEVGRFPLIFTEARDGEPDETVSTWRVRAEPGNDGKPRGPGMAWDGTPRDRPPVWPMTLHGDGWSANWPAPRPVTGQVELRGSLVGDLGISSCHWVRGRVTRARVVTETLDTSDPDQQRWHSIPERQSLREVDVAPRWFDHGLVAPPDAPSTGWYFPVPGDPYVVETGVLVELDLDDVPPLPLRPAIVPTAVAAHGEDLWVADAALPLLVRLRGADPRPGATAPEVHRYTWPGRILTEPHTSRRVHADEAGCWITGPDGIARAGLDGTVRRVDERMVTEALASVGSLLVTQLSADAGPTTTGGLVRQVFTVDRDPVEVQMPAGRCLQAVAADGRGGFVLLLSHQPDDGAAAGLADLAWPARLDADGTVTESQAGPGVRSAALVDGLPVLLATRGQRPVRRYLQPVGDDLAIGSPREVRVDPQYLLAAGGRVFSLGETPDMGRRPEQMAQLDDWWPLPGPITHPEGGRYDLLTELDPHTGNPLDTTLVGRPAHLAVDGFGTVWLPGYTGIYSCPPGPGAVAEPFDVAALLDQQEPT